MRGIILAGGSGTRLHPITKAVSKHLLPVFDKPMVYYPLSVLMLAGVRDILLISTPNDLSLFERLLGTGEELGIRISYAEQPSPRGIADAFIIGADFIGSDAVALILGDNIFYGQGLGAILQSEAAVKSPCTLFGYRVQDPGRYGVATVTKSGVVTKIEEKPARPKSNMAITGLYLYGPDVVSKARTLTPSSRGELEITDLNNLYVARGEAKLVEFGRGMAWLDTGTHESLIEASNFVRILQHRQGVFIACLEEVAFRMGYIDRAQLAALGRGLLKSVYGDYLLSLAEISAKESRANTSPDKIEAVWG